MSFLQVENNHPFSKSDLQMKTFLSLARQPPSQHLLKHIHKYTFKVENMNQHFDFKTFIFYGKYPSIFLQELPFHCITYKLQSQVHIQRKNMNWHFDLKKLYILWKIAIRHYPPMNFLFRCIHTNYLWLTFQGFKSN